MTNLPNVPKEIQEKFDAYLERIKKIKWFRPDAQIDKDKLEKQVKFALECFGVKAIIEYRDLETHSDWDAARDAVWDAAWDAARDAVWDAAWDAARDAARDAVWDAAWDAVWDATRDAVWDAARDAARGAAWGGQEIVCEDLDVFKKKYPNGAFLQLIPIWEMGLYPIGIINEKFVIYVPPSKTEFPAIK